jgi:dipeptidyl aminopeptidase/acylaminoacyl peptidase
MKKATIIILLTLGFISCISQTQEKIEKANFELARKWTVLNQAYKTQTIWTNPVWIPEEKSFFYRYASNKEFFYYKVNPESKTKSELFGRKKLAKLLENKTDSPISWENLNLSNITVNGESIEFEFEKKKFTYTENKNSLIQVEIIQNQENNYIYSSPDSKFHLDIKNHNLFLYEQGQTDSDAIQITDNGEENYSVELSYIKWSPDSKCFAFFREDYRQVEDHWLVNNYSDPRPTLETFKYPMPNGNVEQYSLWIYNTETKALQKAKADKWIDQTLFQLQWSDDSKTAYFIRQSRDWKSLDLCAINSTNGECKTIIEERNHRQLIDRLPYHLLPSTDEIVWWSWRENWGHYYLYDKDGNLKSVITSGSYNSGEVYKIDENSRTLFFKGNAKETNRNPYYHYLYRVNLDGSNIKLLSPEDAEHKIYMPESGNYFVDNFSRADMPPQTKVRDLEGNTLITLDNADVSELMEAGWEKPEIFTVKAADDETDMWGVMFKPFDFDPSKKYPVITYGYPGKETEYIPWKFYGNRWITLTATSLAQYGFIVVVAGNRGGSGERSYEYYNYGENNLRDYPIADKKVVIEQLAKKYSFIDIDKVGIMGQSSGGLMAATAILLEPDFFKVAVAKSGNHDNSLYYNIWNERYGNVEEIKDENGKLNFVSKTKTNNEIVSNLKGRLLLMHGEMDNNVHPSLAYRLAYDLMMANKRFDMFMIPKGNHGFGDNWQYVVRYIELYFVENLMGDRSWEVDILD